MTILRDVDVLREVERAAAPANVARRERLRALRAEALSLVRERALLDAHAAWRIVPLDADSGPAALCLEGRRIEAPWLIPASGRLTALACAVATIGPALEQRIAALFGQRRAALAVALDGVGNELLFALSRRVQDRIAAAVRRQGLTVAGELRAGDPGLDLQAQRDVLALSGADAIGVALTGTLMMQPTKSVSIVQGVGLALPAQTWSRCDHCPSRPRCAMAAR